MTDPIPDAMHSAPKRTPRFIHACLTFGLAALLAACHGPVAQDTVFNAAGPTATTNGLVVVGVRVLQEPSFNGVFGEDYIRPIYHIAFRRVTEDGKIGGVPRQIQLCDDMRPLLGDAFSSCEPGKLRYKVLSFLPGRYTLDELDYSKDMGHTHVVTLFNRTQLGGWFTRPAAFNVDRSFTVAPGSIVYIGDLDFFFDRGNAAAKMALGRHDELAAQALATYPNVHGQMVFEPATGNTPTDPVPGALMPIEGPL